LESENRWKSRGVVVLGINPGPIRKKEVEFYKTNNQTYSNLLLCWQKHIKNLRYYSTLRDLVNIFGFNGPILWTELAKCQSLKGKSPPLQTFRNCTHKFLYHELELVPLDWQLIAVGRRAFEAAAYMYPGRKVIGVPHPTGSHGNFKTFMEELNRKGPPVIGLKEAIWLPDFYRLCGRKKARGHP
jgi:hypothetical protein